MNRQDLRYISDFDWTEESRLIVQPVHAVAVYHAPGGIVLRQRRVAEQFEDQIIFIPQDSFGGLIDRLDSLYNNGGIIDGSFRDADSTVPLQMAD